MSSFFFNNFFHLFLCTKFCIRIGQSECFVVGIDQGLLQPYRALLPPMKLGFQPSSLVLLVSTAKPVSCAHAPSMCIIIRSASAQERTYRLLASVGGADHCLPHCNHLTLFGSAVSVVEFPPQIPVLDASQVSRQETLFHSFKTQLLFCSASFESSA